jgi:hypothetical protein
VFVTVQLVAAAVIRDVFRRMLPCTRFPTRSGFSDVALSCCSAILLQHAHLSRGRVSGYVRNRVLSAAACGLCSFGREGLELFRAGDAYCSYMFALCCMLFFKAPCPSLIVLQLAMKSLKRSSLQHPDPVKRSAADGVVVSVAEGNLDEDADSSAEIVPDAAVAPQSPVASPAAAPTSPMSTRDRFLAGLMPARSCCNLDLIKAPAGTKFNLTAVCIAVFPASQNPDRRYIQLADSTGNVGVSVWNHNVQKFSSGSVGRLVTLTKAVMGNHNGKKQLSMARDSNVEFTDDPHHAVSVWWQSLCLQPVKTCGAVHDMADNSIISVSGIMGHVSTEVKIVNGKEKSLLTLHFVDATGKVDIRSWNHYPDTFLPHVERPLLIRRVRVTSFAGMKICELLDGSGSIMETSFKGDVALSKFWSS